MATKTAKAKKVDAVVAAAEAAREAELAALWAAEDALHVHIQIQTIANDHGEVHLPQASLPEAVQPRQTVTMLVVKRGLQGPERDAAGKLVREPVTGRHIAAWARILPEAELAQALGMVDGVARGAPLRQWLAAQGGDVTSAHRDAVADAVAAGLSRVTATLATRRDALAYDGKLALQTARGTDWTAKGAATWAQGMRDRGLTVDAAKAEPVRAMARTLEEAHAALASASDAVAGVLPR